MLKGKNQRECLNKILASNIPDKPKFDTTKVVLAVLSNYIPVAVKHATSPKSDKLPRKLISPYKSFNAGSMNLRRISEKLSVSRCDSISFVANSSSTLNFSGSSNIENNQDLIKSTCKCLSMHEELAKEMENLRNNASLIIGYLSHYFKS